MTVGYPLGRRAWKAAISCFRRDQQGREKGYHSDNRTRNVVPAGRDRERKAS
jgi:hypothetical protein